MELEKSDNDILGNLYALRGGLSAISAEYDKVRKADADFYEKLNCVADQAGGARYEAPKGTVEYSMWLVNNGFEKELKSRYNSISNNYVEDVREKKYKENARDCKKEAIKYFTLMTLLLVLITGFFIGAFFIKEAFFSELQYWEVLIGILSAGMVGWAILGAAVVMSIIFMVKAIKAVKLYHRNMTVHYAAKKLNILSRHDDSKRVSNELTKAQANLDKLPMVKSNARRVLGERNAAIKPMVQSCNVFYNALKEQFNWLLDERDWQYLDLIIYQIETRRADSVKEALQLVDRELQTERIQRSLGEATQAICHTLARGFSQLQSTINVCCERICSRLDNISNQLDYMSAQMTVQSIQLAGIGGQLAALTDSVNVNNALRAKANVTSAQLCNEVRAVMQYR